ncbi:protein of unknown function [Kyrpidia spormannii]|uniref:Uncharacterized protein n=2 Tax=Kyrpidia spormannii TaxID=2055160 RepID=A0ACA8Z8R4_9BACL|nr:protein of unknown function [Kyrpidia spormannii]CAB3393028.1 protein of unknown function [Kyrpidia spormannii]
MREESGGSGGCVDTQITAAVTWEREIAPFLWVCRKACACGSNPEEVREACGMKLCTRTGAESGPGASS